MNNVLQESFVLLCLISVLALSTPLLFGNCTPIFLLEKKCSLTPAQVPKPVDGTSSRWSCDPAEPMGAKTSIPCLLAESKEGILYHTSLSKWPAHKRVTAPTAGEEGAGSFPHCRWKCEMLQPLEGRFSLKSKYSMILKDCHLVHFSRRES